MDLYREIIIDLYYKCFPKRRIRDEFFNWSKRTLICCVLLVATCILLLSYIVLFDNSFIVVSILYILFLAFLTLFSWSRGKDAFSLAEYLEIQKKYLKKFDEKLKEQGAIKTEQIRKIIDYFSYINELHNYKVKKNKRCIYVYFMSVFIPFLVFFGTELWKLIKINLSTTHLFYVLFYCILTVIVAMFISSGFFLPVKVIFKNIFKNDEERVIMVLREIIIYRDHVSTSLIDDEKIYNYEK
ncbi:hypothetical protein [Tetragenococcus halophilus]|uniref:hypothetical protein n=1 Tax=Tetragenococcus halophilus TaxID=51669 RepID=UPI001B58A94E|nr:hypothetical protein [Tetragenococcus halophilus]GFK29295.1 hypothetical protein YG2_17290 [Tetragenococcus halophilus]